MNPEASEVTAVGAEEHISVLRLLAKAQLDASRMESCVQPVTRTRARVGARRDPQSGTSLSEVFGIGPPSMLVEICRSAWRQVDSRTAP